MYDAELKFSRLRKHLKDKWIHDIVAFGLCRADQKTGGALLEFPVRTAMHEISRVSSPIKYDFLCWTALGMAQLERHGCIVFDLKRNLH